jgi:hypothetical protein
MICNRRGVKGIYECAEREPNTYLILERLVISYTENQSMEIRRCRAAAPMVANPFLRGPLH